MIVYLVMKVALLLGICGACRREELLSLRVGDIVEQGSSLFITLSDTKTHSKRVFSVTADGEAVNALKLYRVINLLPPVAKLTLKIMISLSYFADLIYYP
jgi:integrase